MSGCFVSVWRGCGEVGVWSVRECVLACVCMQTYARTHVTGCRDVTIHRTIDATGQSRWRCIGTVEVAMYRDSRGGDALLSIVKLSQIVQLTTDRGDS